MESMTKVNGQPIAVPHRTHAIGAY